MKNNSNQCLGFRKTIVLNSEEYKIVQAALNFVLTSVADLSDDEISALNSTLDKLVAPTISDNN
jgi:hypothetical protein